MSDILTKIKSTADILGGSVFFANADGFDPEYPENGDLLANGMYIRLEGSDGSVAYISAYEIDKSLEIIDNMTKGKANQADVDAIIETLNDKVSKTDIELFQSELDAKASQESLDTLSATVATKASIDDVTSIGEVVALKADRSVVDTLSEELLNKVDQSAVNTLSENILTKADKATVDTLKRDVQNLKTTLESLSDVSSIEAIRSQITYLNNEINKKLTADALTPITSKLNELTGVDSSYNTRLETVEAGLTKKASTTYVQGQVTEIHNVLTNMATAIDTKATKTEVATKAAKDDVDKLTKKVTELNTTVSTRLGSLDNNYQELVDNLSNKADKVATDLAISEINSSLLGKAEKTEVTRSINDLNTRLYNVESKKEDGLSEISNSLYDLECNVNNALAEVNATLSNQSKQITSVTSNIRSLQDSDIVHEEKLRNEWVRVMTPEAYKRLAPIGDTFSDGSPNPYAKQANTIYMLVRYNKPIAVYIGDIMIAQAEQKGSVGFAYTFPIIFQ
jgi:hypothetical protein